MSSLYIGGAQCVYANFQNNHDWKIFDNLKGKMQELSKKFDVSIARYSLDNQGDYAFVIMHKTANHQCFYEGAFEVDMSVETSDDFAKRAQDFIQALNSKEEFSSFHNLTWSEPKVLYFVIS